MQANDSTASQPAAPEQDLNSRRLFMRGAAVSGLLLGGAAVAQAAKPNLGHGGTKASSGSKTITPKGKTITAQRKSTANTLRDLYPNWNKINFEQIQSDENDHVSFLTSALGSQARPLPTFQNLQQYDMLSFAQTSFALENTGVNVYLLAAPYISDKTYLAAAGSILTIEARHSGYLGTLLNYTMDLFGQHRDMPASQATLLANASPFIASLNGGPAVGFDPANPNDVAILNTALALEQLEATYYNLNVPYLFP